RLPSPLATSPRARRAAAPAAPRADVRLAAPAAATQDRAGAAGVATIGKLLDDKDRTVAAEAVRALGRMHDESSRAQIEKLAGTPGDLRTASVEALGLLGGKQSLGTIM